MNFTTGSEDTWWTDQELPLEVEEKIFVLNCHCDIWDTSEKSVFVCTHANTLFVWNENIISQTDCGFLVDLGISPHLHFSAGTSPVN